MQKCAWCGKNSASIVKVDSPLDGDTAEVCSSCKEKYDNGQCVICGKNEVVMRGKCLACSSMDYSRSQKAAEEAICGLDSSMDEIYEMSVFTEQDYERWVTFTQKSYTPEARLACRKQWIKGKLKNAYTWTDELIDKYIDDIITLVESCMSKVFYGKYILVYAPNINFKIRKYINKHGEVYVLELDEYRKLKAINVGNMAKGYEFPYKPMSKSMEE